MTIAEMHVWFRQYAQQMGMQNVRAILPEQIDLLINSSITDTINQVITQNIGVTNDRVITDNSKIGQINALRSLYKVAVIDASIQSTPSAGHPFVKGEETHVRRIYGNIGNFVNGGAVKTTTSYYVVVEGRLDELTNIPSSIDYNVTTYEQLGQYATVENNGKKIKLTITTSDAFKYLYLVDLAINYNKVGTTTNYFPVRLIDDAYLADTLNDFVLRPRLRTPIAVLYNDQLDIYLDEVKAGSLPEGLTPNKLRVSYIAKPKEVKYAADLGGENVDCDLPEYMHVDILKHAVDLYRIAISGALSASQQAEQNQQRENARNNYRNEGNQQQ